MRSSSYYKMIEKLFERAWLELTQMEKPALNFPPFKIERQRERVNQLGKELDEEEVRPWPKRSGILRGWY